MQTKLKAPSDEGAVVFRRKMTEGEITKICYLLLSLLPSRLRRATFLVRGRLCPQSAKVGASHGVKNISHTVGRWLAAAVETNVFIITFGI